MRNRPNFLISAVLIMGLLFLQPEVFAQRPLKEPPISVSVGGLLAAPGDYDGHRVLVGGRIRSIEIQKGRRGGDYVMVVLEDLKPAADGSIPTVDVILLTLPSVHPGNEALVQGTYYQVGRQAGRVFEHFIDAELIFKEKS